MNTTMNTTTNTPAIGDNSETVLGKLSRSIRKYGQAEATGSASRPLVGVALTSAAYEGLIGEDYAAQAYEEYASGMATVAGKNPLVDNPASLKAQVTKFRAFIKLGALPGIDGRDTLRRTMALHSQHKAAGTEVLSPFQAMYNVCVEQVKNPDRDLSEDEIFARIAKPEKGDKDDITRLVAAYKAAHKIASDIPCEQTQAAVDAYKDAIVELGGDIPPMTKEEKAQAKEEAAAMAYMQRNNLTAVRMIATE